MSQENYPIPKNINNTINNIEFPAKDLDKLKNFYAAVFGWKFKSYGEDYLEFNDGNMLGGFFRKSESKGNGVLVIIYSKDLEKTKSLIVANGGEIIIDTLEFPGGKRFHFKDVEGNELAVWSEN